MGRSIRITPVVGGVVELYAGATFTAFATENWDGYKNNGATLEQFSVHLGPVNCNVLKIEGATVFVKLSAESENVTRLYGSDALSRFENFGLNHVKFFSHNLDNDRIAEVSRDPDDTCVFCFDGIDVATMRNADGHAISGLPCGHYFCRGSGCLDSYPYIYYIARQASIVINDHTSRLSGDGFCFVQILQCPTCKVKFHADRPTIPMPLTQMQDDFQRRVDEANKVRAVKGLNLFPHTLFDDAPSL
eukprot:GDKK01001565.1.p1 GENE.GDKK01001565.1~~GDKK01001565.1.p1  ORF type:complete len:246 (+),score=9.31 GDKK01001565.1:1-738(+)